MSARVLIDTGPLVAMLSVRDQHHQRVEEVLKELQAPFYTCWPVITEAAWLLRHNPEAVERLLSMLPVGFLRLLPLDETAAPAIAKLMQQYAKLQPDLADMCLVYLAEREQIRSVFTFDRHDFEIYRLSRNRSLRLIPKQTD